MIAFFRSLDESNAFADAHPEWEEISMCPGYITGSIFVMYRRVPIVTLESQSYRQSFVIDPPLPKLKKRRGRPPKVRNAVSQ